MEPLEQSNGELSPECPICLGILINPITLYCGHKQSSLQNFCFECLNHPHFIHSSQVCPICRKTISTSLSKHKVNKLLEDFLKKLYGKEIQNRLQYLEKVEECKKHNLKETFIRRTIKILLKYVRIGIKYGLKIIPVLTLVIALILFFKFRKRFILENEYTHLISSEMAKIVDSLKKEAKTNDIDIQSVVLSKIIKYLFTNFPKLNAQ